MGLLKGDLVSCIRYIQQLKLKNLMGLLKGDLVSCIRYITAIKTEEFNRFSLRSFSILYKIHTAIKI